MAQPEQRSSSVRRILGLASLIFAGEAIFALPFHIARFFRPTTLEVFQLTNTELGLVQAAYGVMAMVAYLGGPTADRFSARRLIAVSLVATSLGGLYMASVPGYRGLWLLFGYWGVTTILLFWGALVRATRDWGGRDQQGRAFGIVDGGRGLLAAALASGVILVFQALLPTDPQAATDVQRAGALRSVILIYTGTTFVAALLVWFLVIERKVSPGGEAADGRPGGVWANIRSVLRLPVIWLQAAIIICAYVSYKGMDNFSLFAVLGYRMNAVQGAKVSAIGAWVRPFAAVGAGYLGDLIRPSRVVVICFLGLAATYLFMGLRDPDPSMAWVLTTNIVTSCAASFGLRGVYFALFEEASVSTEVTGTAAGLVSVVGYTPDIFVAPVGGWLLDRSPGVPGHKHYYLFMGAFAILGLLAIVLFRRLIAKSAQHAEGRDTPRRG